MALPFVTISLVQAIHLEHGTVNGIYTFEEQSDGTFLAKREFEMEETLLLNTTASMKRSERTVLRRMASGYFNETRNDREGDKEFKGKKKNREQEEENQEGEGEGEGEAYDEDDEDEDDEKERGKEKVKGRGKERGKKGDEEEESEPKIPDPPIKNYPQDWQTVPLSVPEEVSCPERYSAINTKNLKEAKKMLEHFCKYYFVSKKGNAAFVHGDAIVYVCNNWKKPGICSIGEYESAENDMNKVCLPEFPAWARYSKKESGKSYGRDVVGNEFCQSSDQVVHLGIHKIKNQMKSGKGRSVKNRKYKSKASRAR
jgi:hypothetical protein